MVIKKLKTMIAGVAVGIFAVTGAFADDLPWRYDCEENPPAAAETERVALAVDLETVHVPDSEASAWSRIITTVINGLLFIVQ